MTIATNHWKTLCPATYLLGRLLGEEERAQEVVDFYLQQANLVYSRVAGLDEEKPVVFMDTAAGIQTAEICCRTFGRANLGLLETASAILLPAAAEVTTQVIVWDIRMPMSLMAVVVGAPWP